MRNFRSIFLSLLLLLFLGEAAPYLLLKKVKKNWLFSTSTFFEKYKQTILKVLFFKKFGKKYFFHFEKHKQTGWRCLFASNTTIDLVVDKILSIKEINNAQNPREHYTWLFHEQGCSSFQLHTNFSLRFFLASSVLRCKEYRYIV